MLPASNSTLVLVLVIFTVSNKMPLKEYEINRIYRVGCKKVNFSRATLTAYLPLQLTDLAVNTAMLVSVLTIVGMFLSMSASDKGSFLLGSCLSAVTKGCYSHATTG